MPTAHKTGHFARPSILVALGWYSPAIHRGIARYAAQADWILDSGMSRDGRTPHNWHGDGIISLLHNDTSLRQFVRSCDKPVVNIGDATLPGIPTVRCDDAAIGRMAASHFTARGFRNAAFFLRSGTPSAKRRLTAFSKAITKAGGTFHLIDWTAQRAVQNAPDESRLLEWLGAQLTALPWPLAVFTEHDEYAIEVLHACRNASIPVPEQVAVLGVDDDPLRCPFAPVPLSSIDNNQETEGYRAAALLDRMLKGEQTSRDSLIIPPAGVTTRLSTDILAVNHPHVASVLHHIWQNYSRPINAKTAAATVPISYRRLHDAFMQEIGRSIADEITFKRLEKAQGLLAKTEMKAHEVAADCGFSSEDRMGRIFKRILGKNPLEYRQQNQQKKPR